MKDDNSVYDQYRVISNTANSTKLQPSEAKPYAPKAKLQQLEDERTSDFNHSRCTPRLLRFDRFNIATNLDNLANLLHNLISMHGLSITTYITKYQVTNTNMIKQHKHNNIFICNHGYHYIRWKNVYSAFMFSNKQLIKTIRLSH